MNCRAALAMAGLLHSQRRATALAVPKNRQYEFWFLVCAGRALASMPVSLQGVMYQGTISKRITFGGCLQTKDNS
jgi:hypothetical protein